ncbi:MAG: hypothetical protein QS721_09000 [Candidatus Endonucleobacter sp. (ex Gigantidas childressi)]|nr:hypothetical protein [Candidatus Endonucleobacter sp. (ex Gigantidas childressi)]
MKVTFPGKMLLAIISRLTTAINIWSLTLWMGTMLITSLSQAKDHDSFSKINQIQTLLNIPHKNTPESMIQASSAWRRKPGVERWEMPEIKVSEETKVQVLQILTSLDIVNELKPNKQHYDYVLLLGATIPRMQKRLNQVSRLWTEGVTSKQILFLTGERPLIQNIDHIDELVKKTTGGNLSESARPLTETEGAKMIWISSPLPKSMKNTDCRFITYPRIWTDNQWQRPNTRNTLQQWVKSNPPAGSVLIISDQPHAAYQQVVVQSELPDSFSTNLAAEAADPHTSLAIYLDALALWLHNMTSKKELTPTPSITL